MSVVFAKIGVGLKIKNFAAVDFSAGAALVQRVIVAGEDGSINRVGADFAPGSRQWPGDIFDF